MKHKKEAYVKNRVKRILAPYKEGMYQFWPVQSGYGATTLDCLGIYKGNPFAIETKRAGKKLTPRQELVKEHIEAAGGVVFVIGEKWIEAEERYSGEGLLEVWLVQRYRFDEAMK